MDYKVIRVTYDLSVASQLEWGGIWPREPEYGFNYRGGVEYGRNTSEIKCFCKSERGRLMKRRADCFGQYQICDHKQYDNQTGCGLTVELE